jgi:segregation and condensation protein B
MKDLPRLSQETLPSIIESILFVAEEPVETASLCRALDRSKAEVQTALVTLSERHSQGGIRLQRTGDRVQFVSAPEAGPYVEQYLGVESRQRLSGAALETLAIVAYKQPVTRAAIESVRGVNSDGAVASLVGRGLIEEVGRATAPGRPALFATTMKFLEHFGLKDPSDLPPLALNGAAAGA